MEGAHLRTVDEVVDQFGVDLNKGLSKAQVLDHRRKYGRNERDLKTYSVEGEDWSPHGKIAPLGGDVLQFPAVQEHALGLMGRVSSLCNESHLEYSVKDDGKDQYGMSGEATEAALTVLAEKIDVPDPDRCRQIFDSKDPQERIEAARNYSGDTYKLLFLLEFGRDRKSMSVLSENGTNKKYLHVKGAPESILERCTSVETNQARIEDLNDEMREQILREVDQLTSDGLRVLACAYIAEPSDEYQYNDFEQYKQIESDMTLVGFAGMLDPPRQEVKHSIQKCGRAGVRVVVITGDSQATAEAICRRIGVFEEDEDCKGKSYTKNEVVARASLFSRVEPIHKLALVDLLKKQGEVVAMTGDGVNDATALKKADIGIGMGSGTAVAKEASDMILQINPQVGMDDAQLTQSSESNEGGIGSALQAPATARQVPCALLEQPQAMRSPTEQQPNEDNTPPLACVGETQQMASHPSLQHVNIRIPCESCHMFNIFTIPSNPDGWIYLECGLCTSRVEIPHIKDESDKRKRNTGEESNKKEKKKRKVSEKSKTKRKGKVSKAKKSKRKKQKKSQSGPFRCNKCGKIFKRMHDLNRHLHDVHQQRKDFKCGSCGHKFGRKYSLCAHVKTHHTQKPQKYKCKSCGKEFTTKSNCTRHENGHHGKKQFVCTDASCDKSYERKDCLQRHVRTSHQ